MPLNPINNSLVAGLLTRVSVPSSEGLAETYFAQVRTTAFPYLEAEFPNEKYPDNESGDDWILTVNSGIHLVSIHARVEDRLRPNCFRLKVMRSQQHTQGRRHQRVEAEVYLRCLSDGNGSKEWDKPLRKKVDISPSGIRFFADGEFPLGESLQVELYLLGPSLEKVVFEGKIIRSSVKENSSREVTVNISDIDSSSEEKIAAFCMAQQFQSMKNKAEGFVSLKSLPFLAQ
jgi:hypothetical protein